MIKRNHTFVFAKVILKPYIVNILINKDTRYVNYNLKQKYCLNQYFGLFLKLFVIKFNY